MKGCEATTDPDTIFDITMGDTGMSEISDTPLDKIDVSRPELFRDDSWQPWFERLRREDPVHHVEGTANGAFWSVTRHDLIKQVDTNHQVFSSEAGGISIIDAPDDMDENRGITNFIAMDPPRHDEQRMTVAPSVAPGNLAKLEPLIRERVVDILDNLPIGEAFNWVDKVSIELTSRMLATLFDFPYEDRRKLVRWSDITTDVPQVTGKEVTDMEARQAELMECAQAFYQLWAERAAQPPKFDLISMLAHGESTRTMNEDPRLFLGNILLLIVGGNDTTRNSISGGVIGLNQFPEEYDKLRANPGVIPNMVAEIVRWQTPVIHMRRTAATDFELGGKQIRKGEKVVMWYLSGNRDEAVFEDAERLIIDRPNARSHVAFGFGIHRCMGNRLAEMQLRVLWEEIMKRFRHIELVGEVVRLPNNFIRGIAEVPVRLHPH
ncbi:MAG TPA: cytochrome P450 [Pseudomonadales bacterium]|nr:cytochrome P450 [Pseudomonadales bacterium]